jgi:hypothetical protein
MLIFSAATARAQTTWQPTPPPAVTAENEAWYQSGEPIMFLDSYYYRAGARVFLNRYQMVQTGSYRGVPIYADTTQDPYNVIYVPVANGLLQPYERRRTGSLAGTTGSRAPSFPTSIAAEGYVDRSAPAVTSSTAPPEASVVPEAVPMTGRSIAEAPREAPGSVPRPKGINGVWITFEGKKWFSDGKAVKLEKAFSNVGTYHGFPVYRQDNDRDTIYVPTADGMVAPYSTAKRQPQKKN